MDTCFQKSKHVSQPENRITLEDFFDFKKNVTSKTTGTEIIVPESTEVQWTWIRIIYQKWNPADQIKSERQKGKPPLKPFCSNQGKTEQQQTCHVQAESRNTFCIQPSLYLSKFTKWKWRCHHGYLYPTTQEAQPSAQTLRFASCPRVLIPECLIDPNTKQRRFRTNPHKATECQCQFSQQEHPLNCAWVLLQTEMHICLKLTNYQDSAKV